MPTCPHSSDGECHPCWEERHASEHPTYVEGCLACRLGTVRFDGRFHGPGNVSSRAVQHFWETGEAEVFDRQKAARRAAREDRRTRVDQPA